MNFEEVIDSALYSSLWVSKDELHADEYLLRLNEYHEMVLKEIEQFKAGAAKAVNQPGSVYNNLIDYLLKDCEARGFEGSLLKDEFDCAIQMHPIL